MSKAKLWITLVLGLLVLVLIGWTLSDTTAPTQKVAVNNQEPTYQSQHTVTVVYDPTGKLNYRSEILHRRPADLVHQSGGDHV
jgi:lipopolysaccharide export system protein LptC